MLHITFDEFLESRHKKSRFLFYLFIHLFICAGEGLEKGRERVHDFLSVQRKENTMICQEGCNRCSSCIMM